MGDEAMKYAMKIILANERILEKMTLEKKDIFFAIRERLFEKYESEDYINILKKEVNIANDFQESIINGHFQWLIDKIDNPNQTIFNSQYTINENTSLMNIPYCHFHEIFLDYIDEMDLSQLGQNILKKHTEDLIKIYCN